MNFRCARLQSFGIRMRQKSWLISALSQISERTGFQREHTDSTATGRNLALKQQGFVQLALMSISFPRQRSARSALSTAASSKHCPPLPLPSHEALSALSHPPPPVCAHMKHRTQPCYLGAATAERCCCLLSCRLWCFIQIPNLHRFVKCFNFDKTMCSNGQ